ncbi:uncharacterized protein LOC100206214 isoform X1 [Hydra vulgaris]|uniref:uncharacterized protein LOC100206214 isoform X1 n=1 Tax=Hydra vulgaris TaxID=6087 RepID=UPI0006416330|nr:uncharacterized protein LOC100206214 [Hydra vulgaris]
MESPTKEIYDISVIKTLPHASSPVLPVPLADNDKYIVNNEIYKFQNCKHPQGSSINRKLSKVQSLDTFSFQKNEKSDVQKICVIEIESSNDFIETERKNCLIETKNTSYDIDSECTNIDKVLQNEPDADVVKNKNDFHENQSLIQENGTSEKTSLFREIGKINSFDAVSLSEPCCRICQCDTTEDKLISPCNCCGSVKWVHQSCLVQWMKSSFKDSCELCMKNIKIIKRRKSFSKWQLPTQRPTPVLWVLVFISAIALNLASVVKDASRRCSSTPCLVFYAVGCIGVILGTLFVVYWSKRARTFVNRWMEQNEEWVVLIEDERDNKREATKSSNINEYIKS